MIRRLLIAPLWRMACRAYYRAALRQIDPLHHDVPEIVLRLNELESIGRTA